MSKIYHHPDDDSRNSEYSVGMLIQIKSAGELLALNKSYSPRWLSKNVSRFAKRYAVIVSEGYDRYSVYFPDNDSFLEHLHPDEFDVIKDPFEYLRLTYNEGQKSAK